MRFYMKDERPLKSGILLLEGRIFENKILQFITPFLAAVIRILVSGKIHADVKHVTNVEMTNTVADFPQIFT